MLTLSATTSHRNLDSQRFAGMLSTERESQRVHIPIRIKTQIPERGFFLYFFKKKILLGECRTFASLRRPCLSYTSIVANFKKWQRTYDTTHNIFFDSRILLNMFIIGYSKRSSNETYFSANLRNRF